MMTHTAAGSNGQSKRTGYAVHLAVKPYGFWQLACQRTVGHWKTAYRTLDPAKVTCEKCRAKHPQ